MRRALLAIALVGCSPDARVTADGGASDVGVDTLACEGVTLAPGLDCEVLGGPLVAPRDVWALADGTIIATEMGAGRVVRLEGDRWIAITEELDAPIGVRESSDGRLIVGEENARTLAWLDRETGAREVIASELRNVTYVAIDGGAILVSTFLPGASDGIVFRVDPDTGAAVPYATGLVVPEGLFVASDGTLVVAEWSTSTIWRFPRGGGSIDGATAIASGFDRVYGLLDLGGGAFLVADHAGRVVRVEPDGSQRDVISGIGRPGGLARDAAGALLIAEFVDFGAPGRVLRIPGAAAP